MITNEDLPDYETFVEDLKEIYADGNLTVTYQRLEYYLFNFAVNGKNIKDDPIHPLTYRLIMTKFQEHINEWTLMYGKKVGTQYFSNDIAIKRKNLYEFLGSQMWTREFSTSIKNIERDKYIFGPWSIKELLKQLTDFKRLWTEKE